MPTDYFPDGFQYMPAQVFDTGLNKAISRRPDGSVEWVHGADNPATAYTALTWGTDGHIHIADLNDDTLNVKGFGAKGDGITDDTAKISEAIVQLNSAMYQTLYFPPGQYLVTAGALPPITQSNISVIGAGSGATRILVTGSGVGLQIGLTPPITTSDYVYSPKLEGLAIVKTGSGTVTALKLVGPEFGRFRDLTLYTGYDSPTGDIGLDLYGKSENSFTDIWCQSDTPMRLNTATVVAGDGVDQTNFHNLTLYSMRNLEPLILVTPGTAVGNLSFTGTQTWIGGNAGFYMVDPAPTGNSGAITFDNIRREDNVSVVGTRASGFSIHTDLGGGYAMLGGIYSRNCRFTLGLDAGYRMDGFKIHGNYVKLVVEGYVDGGGTGHVFLDTNSPGAYNDSIVLINTTWGNGTITTTNMVCAAGIGDNATGADYGGGIRVYKYTGTKGLQAVGASGGGGYLQPFWLGTYALWVANSGKLYINNGAPANDTDGTIVGTQAA